MFQEKRLERYGKASRRARIREADAGRYGARLPLLRVKEFGQGKKSKEKHLRDFLANRLNSPNTLGNTLMRCPFLGFQCLRVALRL